MSVEFGDSASFGEDAQIWISPVFEGEPPAAEGPTAALAARALETGRFKGKFGEGFEIAFPEGLKAERLILLGAGPRAAFGPTAARSFGGKAAAVAGRSGGAVLLDLGALTKEEARAAAEVAAGIRLRRYRFAKYKSKPDPADKGAPEFKIRLVKGAAKPAREIWTESVAPVVDGALFARDLVNEPGNVLHPESYADILAALKSEGLKVKILDEPAMEKLGMGALLGVGRGSARQSRLVILEWRGAKDKKAQPLAVVGKGVTFDTGGISIKPAAGMEAMTSDMGGSAVVAGLMLALARRKAKANVVGVVGLVENMPDGEAIRPGDVLTSMSGQTIEVVNTDAEGRLVLADALWYAKETFTPSAMIDLATLTGAVVVALGSEKAGLFANDESLAASLLAAAEAEGEGLWRLPLGQAYDDKIKSRIADMKNSGGREAGSITAAQFLKRFVGEVAWAHLDIAGVALASEEKPTIPRGASGWGVATLDRLVRDRYEDKA